jgi:hypothetical protein
MAHLKQKLEEHPERNLVLFMSYQDKADNEFHKFVEASRTLLSTQDAWFSFAYTEDFGPDIGNLRVLM